MSRFTEVYNKFREGGNGKKVFSKSDFNALSTAMLNDPEYTVEVVKTSNEGDRAVEVIQPTKKLREQIIGSVLSGAGHDKNEIKKYVDEHQFPTLELHEFMSSALTEYCNAGKPYRLVPREGMAGTITIEDIPETTKINKTPGTGEEAQWHYDAHKKVKCTSPCPQYLRRKIG